MSPMRATLVIQYPGPMSSTAATDDRLDPKAILERIRAAAARLRPHVHRTALDECAALSDRAGARLLLKCENRQRGGSFKLRGALNLTLSLDADARAHGLIAPSSGNHAQGVALAARTVGTRAVVVMPEDAPAIKRAAVEGYGARVELCGRTDAERRRRAEELAGEHALTMVPPFDHPDIIDGQGTVGLELLEDAAATGSDPRAVFVPIGGGGLISGVALAAAGLGGAVRVIGVEPEGAAKATAGAADSSARGAKSARRSAGVRSAAATSAARKIEKLYFDRRPSAAVTPRSA